MSRLAMLSPPETGHLNPSLGLARELRRRGHEVLFYQLVDRQPRIESEGFDCRVYGTSDYPTGALELEHQQLGSLSGWRATRFTARLGESRLKVACRELQPMFAQDRLDGIVADEVMAIGPTLGDVLGLPTITIANALPLRLESQVPPPLIGWDYRPDAWGRFRNRCANAR